MKIKYEFEFLNIHINHLTQLGMINIILKCQEKNICKKIHSFHHYLTWFLAILILFAPDYHILVFSLTPNHIHESPKEFPLFLVMKAH
jgi:hypothetical protein